MAQGAAGPLLPAPLDGAGLARLAAHPGLVGIAQAGLRAAVACFGCTAIVKAPRHGASVLWHADGAPWRARGIIDAVTLWVALDRSGPENGGLRVLPASHRTPAVDLVPSGGTDDVFGWRTPGAIDTSAAVDLRLDPGDVSVHGPDLLHASPVNRSARPRRAVVLRYQSASG